MRIPYRPLRPYNIQFATSLALRLAEERVGAVKAYLEDTDAEGREKALECASCFYLNRGRVGGCAMTTWACGICGGEFMHGNTHTPRVCEACAKEHSICRHCGGDMLMRSRRRKYPECRPESVTQEGADA